VSSNPIRLRDRAPPRAGLGRLTRTLSAQAGWSRLWRAAATAAALVRRGRSRAHLVPHCRRTLWWLVSGLPRLVSTWGSTIGLTRNARCNGLGQIGAHPLVEGAHGSARARG